MPVLYRKYRPQTFAQVVGQDHIVKTLTNALASQRIAHAYLFTGSRGVGKTTVARVLARAVNCLKPKNGESCLTCKVCQAFDAGTFLDMVEIDAASNTGVDNIRELLEHVRFQPVLGKFKVVIIDETHMLSKGAFNALLKTLEEPPEHVIFILATTELAKVPATIISRTQRFDFHRFNEESIIQQLKAIGKTEKLKIDEAVLALIARAASGGMRDALTLLDKVSSLGTVTVESASRLIGVTDRQLSADLLSLIVSGNTAELPKFFSSLLSSGIDFLAFNKDFLEYLREILVEKLTGPKTASSKPGQGKEAQIAFASVLATPDLLFIIRLFLKSYKDMASSPDELPLLLSSLEAALKYAPPESNAPAAPVVIERVPEKVPPYTPVQEAVEEAKAVKMEAGKAAINITFEQAVSAWPEICDALKTINGPLSTLLRNAPLLRLDEGSLVVGVKYLFHKEHVESAKNQAVIGQAVAGKLGAPLGVKVELIQKTEPVAETDSALGDALKIFGGELVE